MRTLFAIGLRRARRWQLRVSRAHRLALGHTIHSFFERYLRLEEEMRRNGLTNDSEF